MQNQQPEIQFYLCGGTGINNGVWLLENARTETIKNAGYVALDSSGANDAKDLFPVERMPSAEDPSKLASGSGGIRGRNYPQADAFVEQVLSRHKPGRFNIIICNTSGGTGNMLGLLMMRKLIKAGHPVIMGLITDFSSTWEMSNSVGALTSLNNQTSADILGAVVPFVYAANTSEKTIGEVNSELGDKIMLASLFLTESNGILDYEDTKNMLNYSANYNVPPALSQIRFFDQDTQKTYQGKPPVSVLSLFEEQDSIIARFEGSHVRKAGVFAQGANKPRNTTELHMVLDHGEFIKELEERIRQLDDRKVEAKSTYVQQKKLGTNADSNGMEF